MALPALAFPACGPNMPSPAALSDPIVPAILVASGPSIVPGAGTMPSPTCSATRARSRKPSTSSLSPPPALARRCSCRHGRG